MAVTKLWSVKSNLKQVIDYAINPEKTAADVYTEEQYQALADVLSYAKDEEKTERELYVDAINCNVATARDQFITVKEQYQKTDGIQAYHGYLSFKEQNITPELAQKIGMEFANEIWGKRFQVVVTTHLNTTHLHCHFVLLWMGKGCGEKKKHGLNSGQWQIVSVKNMDCIIIRNQTAVSNRLITISRSRRECQPGIRWCVKRLMKRLHIVRTLEALIML